MPMSSASRISVPVSMPKREVEIDNQFCPYGQQPERSYLITIIFGASLCSLVSGAVAVAWAMGWV